MKAGNSDGDSNYTEYYPTWEKPTAINIVNANIENNYSIYNLAGQKVDVSYKGIVIRNGKKIVRK
jgi:hypothetical protein